MQHSAIIYTHTLLCQTRHTHKHTNVCMRKQTYIYIIYVCRYHTPYTSHIQYIVVPAQVDGGAAQKGHHAII